MYLSLHLLPQDFLAVFNLIWEMGTDLKNNPVLTHTMQNLELIRRHLPLVGINLEYLVTKSHTGIPS